MKAAEILLSYLDKIKHFIQILDSYLEQGLDWITTAKQWIEKILDYLEGAIDSLVEQLEAHKPDLQQQTEDHLFV
ncbi:MAG: hypothetical protein IR153_02685 [Flavobacterium sp.]|nr:hypothetical protein [Flavobacterium sp.]